MKKEVKNFIEHQLSTLKAIEDENVYKYIIGIILKIYTRELTYIQAIEAIETSVEGITELSHQNEWSAFYSLCGAINGRSEIIRYNYADEILETQGSCISKVTGEVYSLICDQA